MLLRSFSCTLVLAMCFHSVAGSLAAESVTVVVGADAPDLEHLAASELAVQWKRLFGVDVALTHQPPTADPGTAVVFLGSPSTNPAIKARFAQKWPALSEQGILLRSIPDERYRGLIVGGGSPRATLWAVYELGHRFGIRYLTRDDIYPDAPIPLTLAGMDVVMEPSLRTRGWQTMDDLPIGSASWSLDEHKRLLQQLVKLKFNRVVLSLHPWQPFVHYEVRGIQKQTALLWYGEQFTIPRDAPGRTALAGANVFENPDFAGKSTSETRTKAGVELARGIVDEAHRLGMTVGISISPLEFPREFSAILPMAKPVHGSRELSVTLSDEGDTDDTAWQELASAKIRAYLATYPTLDVLCLRLPDWPASDFFHRLFANEELLQRDDGTCVELVLQGADAALVSDLNRVSAANTSLLVHVADTARRALDNRARLSQVPAVKVRSDLMLDLSDDNAGVLSQTATGSIAQLVNVLHAAKWNGFSARCRMLAELDPTVHYLSRAAWDDQVTARSAHDDLFTTITGKASVANRLWLGFRHMEQATELIDRNATDFAFPAADMLMKEHRAVAIPEWWVSLHEHYTQAMIEMYRAHSNAEPRARPLLFYWAKRSEYVLEYLNCVRALRAAALASKANDHDQTIEQFEVAVEQLYNALDTLSDIARDSSDRGLIAVLIAHAYQPLIAEYENVLDKE